MDKMHENTEFFFKDTGCSNNLSGEDFVLQAKKKKQLNTIYLFFEKVFHASQIYIK